MLCLLKLLQREPRPNFEIRISAECRRQNAWIKNRILLKNRVETNIPFWGTWNIMVDLKRLQLFGGHDNTFAATVACFYMAACVLVVYLIKRRHLVASPPQLIAKTFYRREGGILRPKLHNGLALRCIMSQNRSYALWPDRRKARGTMRRLTTWAVSVWFSLYTSYLVVSVL